MHQKQQGIEKGMGWLKGSQHYEISFAMGKRMV